MTPNQRNAGQRLMIQLFFVVVAGAVMGSAGCAGDEASGGIVFMDEEDGVSHVALLDGGVWGADVAPQPACPVESTRCDANTVLSCADGQWQVLVECGELTCVGGACVCLPECGVRVCGGDGCGGVCGTCDSGDSCDEAAGVCVSPAPPEVYTAVYVEDIWGGSCSNYLSSGSDIRGAALFDPEGEMVGYWEEVIGEPGTEECQNEYTNAAVVLGEPTQAQLALQGGWVIGTFEGKNAIGPGWSVSVYEYDGSMGGSSETYAVWLATDLDCVLKDDPKKECMVPVSDQGYGTTTFKLGE